MIIWCLVPCNRNFVKVVFTTTRWLSGALYLTTGALLQCYLTQQHDYLVPCALQLNRNFVKVLFTSTRWLSGPYNSLSNSMTRLLKYVENFRFCLGPSVFGGWVWRKTTILHKAWTTCLLSWNLLLLTRYRQLKLVWQMSHALSI